MKRVCGTRQAARQGHWHERIFGWVEGRDYLILTMQSTTSIKLIKWEGSDWIMHSVFVDDMAHTSTLKKMLKIFFTEYGKDFEYTGGDLMTNYLGMEVEQEAGP